MTATPTYGFRISGSSTQNALPAADIDALKQLLAERFPTLQLESLTDTMEQVDAPEETTATPAATTGVTEVASAPSEKTTQTLYQDYVGQLPAAARGLITTDYKGVRGGRLGRGNYYTASMIPGAQVETPTVSTPSATVSTPVVATPSDTPSYTPSYSTPYEAPVLPRMEQPAAISTEPVREEEPAAAPAQQTTLMPAWAKTSKATPTTIKNIAKGLVPSTAQKGVYVTPTSSEASTAAQKISSTVAQRVAAGNTGLGAAVKAGGDPNKMAITATAALLSAQPSKQAAATVAQKALKQEAKGKIELTNTAKKALQKAAKKK